VDYAKEHADEAPKSGAIYGGVAGGMTDEADEFIRAVMADMLDAQSVGLGVAHQDRLGHLEGHGAGSRRLAARAATTSPTRSGEAIWRMETLTDIWTR
jgi:hypothetical protein